jgi:hypothetical protein
MGAGKRVDEVEFREAREIIQRVALRIGSPRTYMRSDFAADEKLFKQSLARKRAKRAQEEAQFIALHGEAAWLAECEQERNPRGVRHLGTRKTEEVA